MTVLIDTERMEKEERRAYMEAARVFKETPDYGERRERVLSILKDHFKRYSAGFGEKGPTRDLTKNDETLVDDLARAYAENKLAELEGCA
jgi:hypothetical protein